MPMRIRLQSRPRERMRKVPYVSANLSWSDPVTLRNPDPTYGETDPTMIAERLGPVCHELTIRFLDGPLALYFHDRMMTPMRVRIDRKSGSQLDLMMLITACTVSLTESSEVILYAQTFR